MPRVKTVTDEQLKINHTAASDAYRKANLDKYRAYSKSYYDRNKAKINEKRRLKRLEKVKAKV
jgi:hypothetical protein